MKKIYYISQGNTPEKHIENVQNVCEAGVKLIQLRMKNITKEVFCDAAKEAIKICTLYNAELIINDNVTVAEEVKSHGIHLGKEDMKPIETRAILGNSIIIGGTANTIKDCRFLASQKVNYIGLGPFRFTNTKKKLSPVLGLEKYQKIISELHSEGIKTPIYAVGGITADDFNDLYATGVCGVVVSGLLSNKSPKEIKNVLDKKE